MKKKEEKKDLFKAILLAVVTINSIGLILLSISNINIKKEIKDIKKEEQKEEVWVDERLDYQTDKSLVGMWRFNQTFNIYTLEITDKGIVTFKYYTNVYNPNTKEITADKIKTEEIDNSEYQLQGGQRGYLENNKIVFNERYNGKEWEKTNASTSSIWKTSEITIKTSFREFELTKQ